MSIKPILMRLQCAMNCNDLINKMVLLPEPASAAYKWLNLAPAMNLVVAYNGSSKSQVALDLTMWIAHQTRLATKKEVTVHVVYVVDETQKDRCPDYFNLAEVASVYSRSDNTNTSVMVSPAQKLAIAQQTPQLSRKQRKKASLDQWDCFEQADYILWKARCVAEEWRGSFVAHLRFGKVATEVRDVVKSESATLLFLGCDAVQHPIVQSLGSHFPCAVLGIPQNLSSQIQAATAL